MIAVPAVDVRLQRRPGAPARSAFLGMRSRIMRGQTGPERVESETPVPGSASRSMKSRAVRVATCRPAMPRSDPFGILHLTFICPPAIARGERRCMRSGAPFRKEGGRISVLPKSRTPSGQLADVPDRATAAGCSSSMAQPLPRRQVCLSRVQDASSVSRSNAQFERLLLGGRRLPLGARRVNRSPPRMPDASWSVQIGIGEAGLQAGAVGFERGQASWQVVQRVLVFEGQLFCSRARRRRRRSEASELRFSSGRRRRWRCRAGASCRCSRRHIRSNVPSPSAARVEVTTRSRKSRSWLTSSTVPG